RPRPVGRRRLRGRAARRRQGAPGGRARGRGGHLGCRPRTRRRPPGGRVVTGHGVRARVAALVMLGVGLLSWLLWSLVSGRGTLVPRPSWLAAVLLVAMAAFVVGFAWPVRSYLGGRGTRRLDPLRAAR